MRSFIIAVIIIFLVDLLFLLSYFLFVLSFSFIAKKEIAISTRATIEPSTILETIQSTSNNTILTNNLLENSFVKKGDLLIDYQSDSELIKSGLFSNQLDLLHNQKQQLEILKNSLESGYSQFTDSDVFGYYQMFQDYANQVATISSNAAQQNSNIASQNNSSLNQQAEIGNLIDETNAKLSEYLTLRSSIESDLPLSEESSLYPIYESYLLQAEQTATDTDKSMVKASTLSQVDSQINQLEATLASYRVQYAGSGTQQAYSDSAGSQIESIRSQYLTRVGQEATILSQKILDLESNAELQKKETEKTSITASEDGIIHVNPEFEGATTVPLGSILGQLYPKISVDSSLKLVAYLSSKEVARIKQGDDVRFIFQDNNDDTVALNSKITIIDSTATKTEVGSMFKVEAMVKPDSKLISKIKYGLEGKLILITGEKTYFNYYVDKITNRE